MDMDFRSKTIALYSVNKRSGKSTVAREMAGFYQIGGKKTLLVDFTLGKSRLLNSMMVHGGIDLSHWIADVEKKLKKMPWHQIKYSPEEISKYTFVHATGLSVLSCRQIEIHERMDEVMAVILSSLAGCKYDMMVFDLNSGVRDYIIRVLSSVNTVLLVTDTYRYDVTEVKMVMERLREADCKTDHFRVLFNKKPTFFDDTPLQISEQFNIPMAGSLPDYPKLNENLQASLDVISEYSTAMKELIAKL